MREAVLKDQPAPTRDCCDCGTPLTLINCAKHRTRGAVYWNRRCNKCRGKRESRCPAFTAKKALIEDARSTPCTDCAQRFPIVCMDFDHLPGHKKEFNVCLEWRWRSIEVVRAEMAKCEVVCSNCHRIRTFRSERVIKGGRHARLAQRTVDPAPSEAPAAGDTSSTVEPVYNDAQK